MSPATVRNIWLFAPEIARIEGPADFGRRVSGPGGGNDGLRWPASIGPA